MYNVILIDSKGRKLLHATNVTEVEGCRILGIIYRLGYDGYLSEAV